MKMIASRDNPTFKRLKKLSESARARREERRTLLDGAHLIRAALDAGWRIVCLVVSESAIATPEVMALMAHIPAEAQLQLSAGLFAALAPVEHPTGVLAEVEISPIAPPAAPRFALLLEEIQDPGNLGAMLRAAAAAGVEVAWLSPGCADAWSPKVLRGGMGAHFVLPIVERADICVIATAFQGQTLAACLGGTPLFSLDLTQPTAFMIGNEGAGLSRALMDAATHRFTIPMPGAIESLNAAAATAVCLFERVRQHRA